LLDREVGSVFSDWLRSHLCWVSIRIGSFLLCVIVEVLGKSASVFFINIFTSIGIIFWKVKFVSRIRSADLNESGFESYGLCVEVRLFSAEVEGKSSLRAQIHRYYEWGI
jgi:hypothetical protein